MNAKDDAVPDGWQLITVVLTMDQRRSIISGITGERSAVNTVGIHRF